MINKLHSAANPWKRAAVIYVVLALSVFAFPGGLVQWLDDRNASGWLTAPLAVARGIDSASAAAGVKGLGQALRKRFAAFAGEDQR